MNGGSSLKQIEMAAPFLVSRFRLQRHRLAIGPLFAQLRSRAFTNAAADSTRSYPSSEEDAFKVTDLPELQSSDDPDYSDWKDKKEEILRDIEPITLLTKEILHSKRYRDGERLTAEDEKAVVDKLLAYHPNAEDKVGCALDSIMVDRHPQFKYSRCLFVVRTDGGWTDFSYKKCLGEYIRSKYPSHAERFIQKYVKRRG